MPLIETATPEATEKTTLADRIVDVARKASHLSHEARLAKSMVTDAAEDGMRAAKRAARRSIEQLEDYRDDAARYVKRQPLSTVAIAAASGLAIGLLCGWAVGRRRTIIQP
jgi:ElaB/YqjD/DUF883 family membrane-anchored ribosome-binding protein